MARIGQKWSEMNRNEQKWTFLDLNGVPGLPPAPPGGPPAGAPGGVPGGAPAGATMSWTLKAENWELKTINHDDMKLRTKDSE